MTKATKLSLQDITFIRDEYLEDSSKENIEFLAAKFDVPSRSIITRLSNMGVYKSAPKTYRTKSGELPVTKAELIEHIAAELEVESTLLEGMEKAPKLALRLILLGLNPEKISIFKD